MSIWRHRVLVTGGRDYVDRESALASALDFERPSLVIQGGARGADAVAREWCRKTGTPCLTVWALWQQYGKPAGHIRNRVMVDDGKPHLVIAAPGGSGTASCVSLAETAGIPVHRLVSHVSAECPDQDRSDD